jgi:hypothetical protein
MLPKRREKGLLTEELPNETLIYDTATHQVHCLNPVARLVWRQCTGRTSEARMVELLRKELSGEADATVVQLTLEKLGRAGLLEEKPALMAATTRRQATKQLAKLGLGAAVALVATIASPSVALAQSGVVGSTCNTPNDCLNMPNLCCCSNPGGQQGNCGTIISGPKCKAPSLGCSVGGVPSATCCN